MTADFNLLKPPYLLAVGAALSGDLDAVKDLKDAGIDSVIDCQAEFDDGQLLASGGLAYLWLPTLDDGQPKPNDWWSRGIEFARAQLHSPITEPHDHRLLCHCAAGVNRGPSMAYGVLRAVYRCDPAEAEAVIREVRPQVGIAYKADFERYWNQRNL